MSIRKQAFNGIKWQVTVNVIHKVLSFLTMIVLARKLGPSVFGLFSLTLVVVSSFELFKSMGVDAALIRWQSKDIRPAADTAFVIIPALGFSLFSILFVCAPAISRFMNAPEMEPVLRTLGMVFVVNCFSRVHSALLERRMQFKIISLAELVSTLGYCACAITLAFLKPNVWALVYAFILKGLLYLAVLWKGSSWKPAFRFHPGIAKEMLHFGKYIFLGSMVWFLRMNLDNVLVGKYLGAAVLGLYAVAFNIANFGADFFAFKINRVVYPAFSRMSADSGSLKSAFLKTFTYLAVIGLPLGTVVFLLGGDFIGLAYGNRWLQASPVVRILAFTGIFNTLNAASSALFLARGRSRVVFGVSALQVVLFLLFIRPATYMFGAEGVAFVVSAAGLCAFALSMGVSVRMLSLSAAEVAKTLRPALVASFFIAAGIVALQRILALQLFRHVPVYSIFLVTVVSAAVLYVVSLVAFEKRLVAEIKETVL